MTVSKQRKNVRQRGHKTHGWGSMKKHRGAGNRGGRGNAGSGKRGDAKKPSYWKENKKGKVGFKKKGYSQDHEVINIGYFEDYADKLLKDKKITEEKGVYVVDLKKLGYDKLLSTGKLTKKFKIKAEFASAKAVEKIKKAGGEVLLPSVPVEQPAEVKEE